MEWKELPKYNGMQVSQLIKILTILRGTRNLSFLTYHKISYFGIYLEHNQFLCLIMDRELYQLLISPLQNSIWLNIIELRHIPFFISILVHDQTETVTRHFCDEN